MLLVWALAAAAAIAGFVQATGMAATSVTPTQVLLAVAIAYCLDRGSTYV